MKGLDTNVLVRYITQDDKNQAQLAEQAIDDAIRDNEKLVIHPIVLCELVWVLESAYGFNKSEILPVLDGVLRTAQFHIIDKDICWDAYTDYTHNAGDFADYCIGRANAKAGATVTLTFDKALSTSALFSTDATDAFVQQ